MSGIGDFSVFGPSVISTLAQQAFGLVKNDANFQACFGPNMYLIEGSQLPPTTDINQVYCSMVIKQMKYYAAEKVWVEADFVVGVTLPNDQTMTAIESPMSGTNIFFYTCALFTNDATDGLADPNTGKILNVPCSAPTMDWANIPKELAYRFMRCHVVMQAFIDPTTGNLIYGG